MRDFFSCVFCVFLRNMLWKKVGVQKTKVSDFWQVHFKQTNIKWRKKTHTTSTSKQTNKQTPVKTKGDDVNWSSLIVDNIVRSHHSNFQLSDSNILRSTSYPSTHSNNKWMDIVTRKRHKIKKENQRQTWQLNVRAGGAERVVMPSTKASFLFLLPLVLLREWKRKCRRVHGTFEMSSNSFNRFTGNEQTNQRTNEEWKQEIMNKTKPYHIDVSPRAALELQFFAYARAKATKIRSKKIYTFLHRCSTQWSTQSLSFYLSFTFYFLPHLHITYTHTPNTSRNSINSLHSYTFLNYRQQFEPISLPISHSCIFMFTGSHMVQYKALLSFSLASIFFHMRFRYFLPLLLPLLLM